MTRKMIPALALILFASACSHHQDLTKPQAQDNFGVQMARMNLWREALFRFQRAVQINPSDAMAHNNLAVAWEANGDFEKARKEYLEALKLDRSNQYIQKNYSRYVEFLSRNRKRQLKEVKTAAAVATPAAPATGTPPTTVDSTLPGQPVAVEPVKPAPPTTPPPSDLPPQPKPPAPTPPGGAR
jgi:Tfp pilus assembly protein PilF